MRNIGTTATNCIKLHVFLLAFKMFVMENRKKTIEESL